MDWRNIAEIALAILAAEVAKRLWDLWRNRPAGYESPDQAG